MKQDEFNPLLGVLSDYLPKTQKYLEAKNKLLDNAKIFKGAEKKLLRVLKINYFC